ncbi:MULTISPECIES: hypothetical protein [Enterobacterales]|uniref:hypothetical protein n=1 Tax=Enterobacterales TaxID=91347 RepID=UPI002ED84317
MPHIEIAVLYSLLGAFAHLASIDLTEKPVVIRTALDNLVISAFAAAITYLVALRLGWQVYGIGLGCGMAAWMGAKILTHFEQRFLERLDESKNRRIT